MRESLRPFSLLAATLALVLPAASAHAGSDEAAEALEEARRVAALIDLVEERYRGVPAFEQSFVQASTSRFFGPDQEARGTIRARQPDRLRFDYEVPEGQVGVYDGKAWWLLSPEERHVAIHDASEGDFVVSLLTGRLELAEAFSISASEPEGGIVTLELIPRELRDDVERVWIDLDPEKGDLRRVEIEDPLQNLMTYRFGPLEAVDPMPMSSFTLAIPEGYTVNRE